MVTGPMRFSRVKLQNWKNFAACEVALPSRVFLVGPNASGKSNFLDVFRFLHDLVALGGGLREAISRRGGVSALRCLAASRYQDVQLQVTVVGTEEWRYELAFNHDNQQRPQIKKEKVLRGQRVLLDRPNSEDERDPARLSQTCLEQSCSNKEFRVLADFFQATSYLHNRSAGCINDTYGDFLELLAKVPERTQKARLGRIQNALRTAIPQFKEIELWYDASGAPHLRSKYEHWRPRVWQTEEQFSDGTLRLMRLLWAIMDGNGPLLLEGPELSLHSDIVRHLPQMFARVQRRTGRQLFVSTHSPELLLDEETGLDQVLLLQPTKEGTHVTRAADHQDICSFLQIGISLAESVIPKTSPAGRIFLDVI